MHFTNLSTLSPRGIMLSTFSAVRSKPGKRMLYPAKTRNPAPRGMNYCSGERTAGLVVTREKVNLMILQTIVGVLWAFTGAIL